MKIVKAKLVMQVDEELDDMSVEEIADGGWCSLLDGVACIEHGHGVCALTDA